MAVALEFERDRAYRGLLDLILGGDGQVAQRLIRDHLSKGLDIRTRIFKNLAEYTPDARVLDKELEA